MSYDLKLMIEGLTSPESGGLDVLAFDWGGGVQTASGSGQAAGKAKFNPFSITRKIDKASPTIFKAMVTGTILPAVQLGAFVSNVAGTIAADSSAQQPFLVITMKDVVITSVQVSGAEAADDRPIEAITFVFSKVQYEVS